MSQPDIHLYTAATMNGFKPVIFLEEAGIPYDLTFISFAKQEQKAPEYLKLNPNGKIPTIIDHSEDRAIFESGEILWHMAEKYNQFLPKVEDSVARSEVRQWMFFQAAHLGPMMGQAMYFQRIAVPNGHEDPFAIKRYVDESRRLMEVLNTHLDGRDWMVGGQYTIADMMTYPWARAYPWAKVSVEGLEHLQKWFDRIDARPAIQRALTIPEAIPAAYGWADENELLERNAARFKTDVKDS